VASEKPQGCESQQRQVRLSAVLRLDEHYFGMQTSTGVRKTLRQHGF
jgi:hypothetical protein